MTTEITEYSKTDAALIELRSKYANALFDVTTTKGMQSAKEARAELRGYRVELEKTRKEIKAPALLRCQMIDAEAKRITAALELLEDPINEQIKAEETRKEAERAERVRQETERLAAIRARIDGIKNIPLSCINKSSSFIFERLLDLSSLDLSDLTDVDTFSATDAARKESIAALESMYTEVSDAEAERIRLAVEREELAKREAELRAQREAQERELAEQQAKAKVELDRQRKEQEAAAAAERARVEEEARIRRQQEDAERTARAEQERIEREAKIAADAEAERARLDKIKAGATLLSAAVNALRFLIDKGHGDSDVAFELTCAIDKETQQQEAA